MGCHFLLQRIFPTQGSNPCLMSPALAGIFFTTSATWEALKWPYFTYSLKIQTETGGRPWALVWEPDHLCFVSSLLKQELSYIPPFWLKWTERVRGAVVSGLFAAPPGSSVHGILQARILQWAAISFSRGSSPPRDGTLVSCTAGRFFTASHQGSPLLS